MKATTNLPWPSTNLLIYLNLNGLPPTSATSQIKPERKTMLDLKNYLLLHQLHGTGLLNQTRLLQLKIKDNVETATHSHQPVL